MKEVEEVKKILELFLKKGRKRKGILVIFLKKIK